MVAWACSGDVPCGKSFERASMRANASTSTPTSLKVLHRNVIGAIPVEAVWHSPNVRSGRISARFPTLAACSTARVGETDFPAAYLRSPPKPLDEGGDAVGPSPAIH